MVPARRAEGRRLADLENRMPRAAASHLDGAGEPEEPQMRLVRSRLDQRLGAGNHGAVRRVPEMRRHTRPGREAPRFGIRPTGGRGHRSGR